MATERHGSLASIPLDAVAGLSAELAPQVGLHPGTARAALRKAGALSLASQGRHGAALRRLVNLESIWKPQRIRRSAMVRHGADLVDAFLEDVKGVVAAGSFVP